VSRAITEPVDVAPFVAWCKAREAELRMTIRREWELAGDPKEAHFLDGQARNQLRALLGWLDDSGARRLYRYLTGESTRAPRVVIEEAIEHAEARWSDVYAADCDDVEFGEAYCWSCQAFVVTLDDACAWCDRPIVKVDLSTLPPRERPLAPLPDPDPGQVVRHRPRVKKGRPFYLDVRLDRRRSALEVFAETASVARAAEVVVGMFASIESASTGVRTLLVREGWYEPNGARGEHTAPALREAALRVRQALDDGTWDHVAPETPSPSQRRVFDERVVREALWLYWYDGLSFRQAAERLLPRTRARGVMCLKSALIDEWDRRGWPRRTARSAAPGWRRPKAKQRCAVRRADGGRCKRWAQKEKRVCFDHDEARMDERVARNTAASRKAYEDAVPLDPWRAWMRWAVKEVGSVAEIHRRVGGVVSYDTLAEWAKLRPRGGAPKVRSVRRSTIDRVLAAWGDGTTFEDVYLPVVDREELAA
jgi:hypothetical protein